jgi:hypothetical protein
MSMRPVSNIDLFPHFLYTNWEIKAGVNYTIPKINIKKDKASPLLAIEAKNWELYENTAKSPLQV